MTVCAWLDRGAGTGIVPSWTHHTITWRTHPRSDQGSRGRLDELLSQGYAGPGPLPGVQQHIAPVLHAAPSRTTSQAH